jgi:aspartokinase/homoserine dehydrogenase 1
MKILKFGGTSVGSIQAIQKTLQAISTAYQSDSQIAVVFSAMSGVTNLLQKMATEAAQNQGFKTDLTQLESTHFEVIQTLVAPKNQNDQLIQFKILFNELEQLLDSIKILREVSPRINDLILSFGERMSALILTQLINDSLAVAQYNDTRKLIVTDSQFGNAKVDFYKTQRLFDQWKSTVTKNTIQVFTGFIACDSNQSTTTLGRGGSDYTAALLASMLQADEIQIWTDVDGFMTADPRLVPHAITLPQLSYAEAMELSYFGAKVIYPPTMIPAIEMEIPIRIKNTFNQDHPGTLIHQNSSANFGLAKGIASINEVSLINIEGSGLVGFKGFSGRLFNALASVQVNIIMITQASSEHSISIAIEPQDLEKAQKSINQEFEYEFLTKRIENIGIENEVSILAVVGENMKHSEGLAGKVFHALGRVGVNIMAIAQGSSELNISMVIKKVNLSKAINAIHNDLFLSKTKNAHLAIAGVGNIGKTLLKQIENQSENLLASQDLKLNLIGVSNSTKNFVHTKDLQFDNWDIQLTQKGIEGNLESFVQQILDTNLPNIVFVDNSASTLVSRYYQTLLENNISVVTCNKIATSDTQINYDQLKRTAVKKNVNFLYETNVGAGLPIIKTLQDLIHSGDRIVKIEAILSGTISYIFNQYKGPITFAEVVQEAQDKGFTEPNPVDDLSGKDFARKMLIIARESGLKLEMEDIVIHPILPAICLQAQDVSEFYNRLREQEPYFADLKQKAMENKQVLRYIGSLEKGKVQIKIESVDAEHPFFNLTGSDNIISVTTQRYLNNPLVVKGPGAGAEVTAAGVFADIMRAAASF